MRHVYLTALVAVLTVTSQAYAQAPKSDWTQQKGVPPALTLENTAFANVPSQFTSLLHNDGSKSDWAVAGSITAASANLVIMINRTTEPSKPPFPLKRNLADFSELKFVSVKFQDPFYSMTTRFGELRAVRFEVDADGIRKTCIGFHRPESSTVPVKGFACFPNAADATPEKLACTIEQIRFVKPDDEPRLSPSAKSCGAVALTPTDARPASDRL